MRAKTIAEHLPPEWEAAGHGVAYPSPTARVTLQVDMNRSLSILGFTEADPAASNRDFAEDLLATLNPVLCPSSQDALVEALVTQMSTWQADTPQGPDYVENLLRKLLLEHQNRQKAHHDRNAKQPLAALRCLPGGGDPVLPDTCAAIRA